MNSAKFLLFNNIYIKNIKFLKKKSKIIILLFILYFIEYKKIINNNSNEIIFDKNSNYSIYNAAKKSIDFLVLSWNGILFSNFSLKINKNPKVSVVIPAYNAQKYIKKTIRSIQNQEMEDLDIVIVNDFSIDNTSKIIEEIAKEDKRIKVLNNKKNMGTLYTRCIGTLTAKGNYIFPLDSDDMLLDKDIINKIYNLAKEKKNDIVVFNSILVSQFSNILKLKNLKPILNIKKNKIIHQPELSNNANIILWSQCIRARIYKKAINIYGKKKYSIYMTYYEDAIINHIIYQIAKSSAYIQNYGILYISKKGTVSTKVTERERNIATIKYIEIMLDFSRNTFALRNIIVNKIIYYFKKGNFEIYYLKDIKFKKELNLLLRKIFSSKYLSSKNKLEIRKKISIKYLDYSS